MTQHSRNSSAFPTFLFARGVWIHVALLAAAIVIVAIIATASAVAQKLENAGKTTTGASIEYEGGKVEATYGERGDLIDVKVYDKNGVLRRETVYNYFPGTHQDSSKATEYYREDGSLEHEVYTAYSPDGQITEDQIRSFDQNGIQTGGYKTDTEQKTKMKWSWHDGAWVDDKPQANQQRQKFIEESWKKALEESQKLPVGSKPISYTGQPLLIANLGVVVPRAYQAGAPVTASVMFADRAKIFDGVPGLSVRTFQTLLPSDVAGWSNFSGLEIGVKGSNVSPVVNGLCTFTVPKSWTGPLQIQIRQGDAPDDLPLGRGKLIIDPFRPAPEIPPSLIAMVTIPGLRDIQLARLKHAIWTAWRLQWDADDLAKRKIPLIQFFTQETADWWFDEASYIAETLPDAEVDKLAKQMIQDAQKILTFAQTASAVPIPPDQIEKLKDWISELEYYWLPPDEQFYTDPDGKRHLRHPIFPFQFRQELRGIEPSTRLALNPFWMSPVLVQGKLGALHGPVSGDCNQTSLKIDGRSMQPLAVTPGSFYYIPPEGLTPGAHQFQISGAGIPETTIPGFYMTMDEGAGQMHLASGQSTNYFFRLNVGSLPGSAWSTSFFPTDLMDLNEIRQKVPGFPIPGPNQPATITFLITNDTPRVIKMQDAPSGTFFQTLNAQSFGSNGAYQHNGTVTANITGNWMISAVARPFFGPVAGFGNLPAGASSAPVSDDRPSNQPSTTTSQPTREDLETRVKEAQKKYNDAKRREDETGKRRADAWENACESVATSIYDRWWQELGHMYGAETAWEKARDAFDKDPLT